VRKVKEFDLGNHFRILLFLHLLRFLNTKFSQFSYNGIPSLENSSFLEISFGPFFIEIDLGRVYTFKKGITQ